MKRSLNILQSHPNGANKTVYQPAFPGQEFDEEMVEG